VAHFDHFLLHSGTNGTVLLRFENLLCVISPSVSNTCQSDLLTLPVYNTRHSLTLLSPSVDQKPGNRSTLTYTIRGLSHAPLSAQDVLVDLLLAPSDYMGQLALTSEALVEFGAVRITPLPSAATSLMTRLDLQVDQVRIEVDVLILQSLPGAYQFGCRVGGIIGPIATVWLLNEVGVIFGCILLCVCVCVCVYVAFSCPPISSSPSHTTP
jgi:hypothetical protein